ncbi:MAG: S-layer homology domain-containing protein [Acutalibacter sp.]|nr:S-layer homology domain-containing protein [Acutalibacter sp.]
MMKEKKSIKKIISLLLVLCVLCASLPTTAFAAGTVGKFKDVSATAYYAEAVQWAVGKNITSGTTATTFSPNQPCTRAQAVTFLWNAKGKPEPTTTANPFTDVTSDKYYYKAVLWAVENKVTSGTSATTFSPNSTCTRGQIVTFLWNAAGKPTASGAAFSDVPSTQYYATAVAWAVGKKITSGTGNGKFSPNASCTRAQIVTFLYNESGEKVEVEPTYGENTRWTAELAPVQSPSNKIYRQQKIWTGPGWLYGANWTPTYTESEEWIAFANYDPGANMLPYFNADEKDIRPVPSDAVINNGNGYWTMIGYIPHGGYVENNRIYVKIYGVSWWSGKGVAGPNPYSMETLYDWYDEDLYDYWRIDVTSVDGKMTAEEKKTFDLFNTARLNAGLQPYKYDEKVQMEAEFKALIQATSIKAKADAYVYGLAAPRAGFQEMFNCGMHNIQLNTIPTEYSGKVTFNPMICGEMENGDCFGDAYLNLSSNHGYRGSTYPTDGYGTTRQAQEVFDGIKASAGHWNNSMSPSAVSSGFSFVGGNAVQTVK